MGPRAIFLVALAALLLVGTVRGDDLLLPGSDLKVEDAVAKTDAVFVGKFINLGAQAMEGTHAAQGPEYHGALVKVVQTLKGKVDAPIAVSIYPVHEVMPQVGTAYIVFVKNKDFYSSDPFRIVKLMLATDDNIAMVKKLISN